MPKTFTLFILILIVTVSACTTDTETRNELTRLNEELRYSKEQREMYKIKIDSLYESLDFAQRQYLDENYKLQMEIKELKEINRQNLQIKSSRDTLQDQYTQLANWNKALVEGYGPGIWKYSDNFFLPLYEKEPKIATVQGIIDELNEYFIQSGNPVLILKQNENREVHLGVSNELQLISQMGSTGADAYIKTTVFSLTSLEDVDCVYFDIQEGDHAGPGKFCR